MTFEALWAKFSRMPWAVGRTLDDDVAQTYRTALASYDNAEIAQAFSDALQTLSWFPQAAELVELCAKRRRAAKAETKPVHSAGPVQCKDCHDTGRIIVVRPRGRVLVVRDGKVWLKEKTNFISFYRGCLLRCHCDAGDKIDAPPFHAPTLRHLGWYAESEAVNKRHGLRAWDDVADYLAHVEANVGATLFEVHTPPPRVPRDYPSWLDDLDKE